jgi:hypothetical protein
VLPPGSSSLVLLISKVALSAGFTLAWDGGRGAPGSAHRWPGRRRASARRGLTVVLGYAVDIAYLVMVA